MKNEKDQRKIITVIIIILILIVGILLFINRMNIQHGKESQEQRTLTISMSGQNKMILQQDWIKKLDAETFDVSVKSSGKKPEEVTYTGVELRKVLQAAQIDLKGKEKLVFHAADGYVVTAETSEIDREGNFYIVYSMNGNEMKTREEGGFGPYQLVIRNDSFSQRWCKYLSEVEIL